MTFADHVLQFHRALQPDWKLPRGFEIIFPFDNEATWACMESFYQKYFSDQQQRTFIFGINPGRFGAGVTGVAFTDPWHLQEYCQIESSFPLRKELSSIFIYEVINAFGGPIPFFEQHYLTSVCPLGFLTKGINCNYYDDKLLQKKVEPKIIENIIEHTKDWMRGSKVVCLGMGKNYKYLAALNQQHEFFDEVIPLPHPRWVMQYRRKHLDKYLSEYLHCFEKLL